MVDEQNFSCSSVLGFDLCHGYGPSFGLQWAAIGQLILAMLLQFFLLFVPSTQVSSTSYEYVTVPLIAPTASQEQPRFQRGGIIISGPPQGTQPRAQTIAAIESL